MGGDRHSHDVPMSDELTRRLRELDWPTPPPGLKERSLEEFQRRLAAEGLAEPDAAGAPKR